MNKKELCVLLHEIFEDCNPHGANAMDTLRDYVRRTAGIPDPPGYWYSISDGYTRNKINDMVNHFTTCVEEPGPFYDDNGTYQCMLCHGWNGLHHNCEIANLRLQTYSFNEYCEGFLKLLEKHKDIIPRY